MAVVIADAGPLIALAKINQLVLLSALFGSVLVTQAVVDECLQGSGSDAALIREALQSDSLQCINTPDFKHEMSRSLGLGEQSCLEYALQADSNTLLILDDALARKQALRLKLTVVGTAALLFTAQHKGLIADAELLIHKLNQTGYRISADVVALLKRKQQPI